MAKTQSKAKGKVNGRAATRPRKRKELWTPKRRKDFLTLVALGWTVVAACAEVGMSQSSVYILRDRDEKFKEAMAKAYEDSTALLEGVAFKKAAGWVEPVIQKDGSVRMVEKHDPILLMFLLKARKPRMYRDQVDINLTEKRHIIVDLMPVEKDPKTGRLMLVESEQPPLLTKGGDGDDGQGCLTSGPTATSS